MMFQKVKTYVKENEARILFFSIIFGVCLLGLLCEFFRPVKNEVEKPAVMSAGATGYITRQCERPAKASHRSTGRAACAVNNVLRHSANSRTSGAGG